jgi:hyaluronan synthase
LDKANPKTKTGPNNMSFQSFLDTAVFYLPLGVVGLWRWAMFCFKTLFAIFYRPKSGRFQGTVSIVTPVYNEPLDHFMTSLHSWIVNRPYEIIAVIDHTNLDCIHAFKAAAGEFPSVNLKLIVTQTPGKRPALKDGIEASSGEITALVDCDTVWAPDLLEEAMAPFVDPEIVGVATRQEALAPANVIGRLQNMSWSYRYDTEMPFLSKAGDAVTCLSGRTALYRREVLEPHLPGLVSERFLGQLVISGDDKYLTEKVQEGGGKTFYQASARAYTFTARDVLTLIKQQTRWTRNSWRSDIRSMFSGWVWDRPALAIHLVDRSIAPFTLLLGPIYFGLAIALHEYLIPVVLVAWWITSRSVKLLPHLIRHPADILIMPAYVIMTYMNAVIRLHALVTLNRQGWITRWSKDRLAQDRATTMLFRYVPYGVTAGIVVGLVVCVFALKGIVVR